MGWFNMNDREYFLNTNKKTDKRYDMSKFMEFNNGCYDVLTSSMLDGIADMELGGYYTVEGEDGMPWLLSHKIYKDTQYWWILMTYNGFSGIEDIVNGSVIKYPSINAIQDFYFTLKTRERTST